MRLEDVLLNDELVVGEECYYDHNKYIYNGVNEEGKHIIIKKTSDSEVTRFIDKKPHRPKLPLGLFFKNKRTGEIAELTDYTQMLGKMYYKLTMYEDVFKGYEHETYEEIRNKWELLEENPFMDEDELLEQIDTFNSEISKYEKQIEEIKKNYINPIKEKRGELYKKCKHDWYKYDEVEIGGRNYEQECVCNICGKEKINRFISF